MASVRHLSKPPIQEAVIDFVFSGSQMERDGLDSLASTFPEELWQRQTITTTTVQAQIGGAEGTLKPKATSAFEGFSMRELDGSRIVQIREEDRKSTRLNPVTHAHLVCRLLLEKKNRHHKHITI